MRFFAPLLGAMLAATLLPVPLDANAPDPGDRRGPRYDPPVVKPVPPAKLPEIVAELPSVRASTMPPLVVVRDPSQLYTRIKIPARYITALASSARPRAGGKPAASGAAPPSSQPGLSPPAGRTRTMIAGAALTLAAVGGFLGLRRRKGFPAAAATAVLIAAVIGLASMTLANVPPTLPRPDPVPKANQNPTPSVTLATPAADGSLRSQIILEVTDGERDVILVLGRSFPLAAPEDK